MTAEASPVLGAPDNWVAPLARAVPALVLGLGITFSQDHSASLGLTAFGGFAVVSAAVVLASGFRADRALRGVTLVQGVVTAAAGVTALLLPEAQVGAFVLLVSAWAIITGAIEFVNGIRFRRSRPAARDWSLTGGATLLLALVFLLMPQGFSQDYGFEEKGEVISGVLTSDIVLVGVLGAWAAIVGVQLVIAAVSLRSPSPASAKVEA